MKIWKIVSGILSAVLSIVVIYRSFFAGVLGVLSEGGQFSGAAGIAVAVMLAAGGIVSIATSGGSRGGDIAMAILFGTGGVVGLVAGGQTDLRIWAVWSLACAIVAMVDIGTGGCDKIEEEALRAWVAPVRAGRSPVTLSEVLAERDPRVRNAAVDALPEREAKNYLKQMLNAFASQQEDETVPDDGLIRTLIAILAVLGVFIIAVVVVGIISSAGSGGGQAEPSSPMVTVPASFAVASPAQESATVQPSPEQSQTPEPTSTPGVGAGTLGNCYVEIKNAFLTQDFEGETSIVVTYEWTNNGEEDASAMEVLAWKASQGSTQLVGTVISRDPRYEPGTSGQSVRPGATAQVQCAFTLENDTSPVVFELSVFGGVSRDRVSMRFTLAELIGAR